VCIVQVNKDARAYRTKVAHNCSEIEAIYSKDGEGARIGGESAKEQNTPVVEESPDVPQKRKHIGDAILCIFSIKGRFITRSFKHYTEPLHS
jgi:hypothetical protein